MDWTSHRGKAKDRHG